MYQPQLRSCTAKRKETLCQSISLWIYLLYNTISTSYVDCEKKAILQQELESLEGNKQPWLLRRTIPVFSRRAWRIPQKPSRDWNFTAVIWPSQDFGALYLFCWKLHLQWTLFKYLMFDYLFYGHTSVL